MRDPLRHRPNVPLVDLDTICETLVYMRDDIQRVAGLEQAAERLTEALDEIAATERRRLAPLSFSFSILDARCLPRRKH